MLLRHWLLASGFLPLSMVSAQAMYVLGITFVVTGSGFGLLGTARLLAEYRKLSLNESRVKDGGV